MLSLVLLLSVFMGSVIPVAAADGGATSIVIVKLSPTDDSYVNPYVGWRDARDDNYGASTIMVNGNNNIPMLKFDLSSVTDPIQSATLKLNKINNPTGYFQVYKGNDDSWSESTVTWNNHPSDWGELLSDACTTNPCSAGWGAGVYKFNVSASVVSELANDPGKQLTLSLVPTDENGVIKYDTSTSFDFASKEHATVDLRPVLEIETLKAITPADRVVNDIAILQGQFEGKTITSNLTLPAEGSMNTSLTWSSDQPEVISKTGVVTRPEWYESDQAVILTVNIAYEGVIDSIDLHVIVPKQPTPTDEQRVAKDKELLLKQFNNMSVFENVYLPPTGSYGFSDLTWSSSNPAIITDTGLVVRPLLDLPDATVKMTVSLRYGAIADSAELTFLVPKQTMRSDSKLVTLQGMIAEAHNLQNKFGVGTAPGQVPQTAMDKFAAAIVRAQDVYEDTAGDPHYAVEQLRNAGTAFINSTKISEAVVDVANNKLAYSSYRVELNRLVWEALTMLLIEPEMYSAASKLAVQDQIHHAEAVLDGSYEVPFIRNREFNGPRPDEDIQFAIEHYAKASHPFSNKYGLKTLISWYPSSHILSGTYNTLQLNPTDDAFIASGEKTVPHNGETLIYGEGRTAYLKFDLSSITASVVNAVLNVTNFKFDLNTTEVHYEANDAWSESTLVYPTGNLVLGPIANTFTLGTKDNIGAGTVDLTKQVQLELLGDKVLSLSMDNVAGTRWASEIYSNNTSQVAKRPYIEFSLNQIVDAKLQQKFNRIVGDARALIQDAVIGTSAGQYPQLTVDTVIASITAAEEANQEGNVEKIGAALVDVFDAMRDMREAQLLRSETEPGSTLYLTEEGIQSLRDNIEQSPELKKKYEEAKAIADQVSLEDLQGYSAYLERNPNYSALNGKYKVWSGSDNLLFTPPTGTVSASLQFSLDSADNEAVGLGHTWIDNIKISPANAPDLVIPNAGFELGTTAPELWQPVNVKGNPILRWENRTNYSDEGTHSVYIENPTAADQGAWVYQRDIPLEANLGYTLTFAAKNDGKLKKGVKAVITYKNASGSPIGSIELINNRKSSMGPNSNLSIQADALVYAVTGDIEYAKKAKERILWNLNDFLQGAEYWQLTDARPDNLDSYGKVQGGRVASILASAYTYIKDAGVFTEAEQEDLLAKFDYMNQFLNDTRDRTELDDYTVQVGASNWESDAVIGASMLSMVLPELPNSKQLIINANKLLKAQLAYTIGPEGEWPESIRYLYAVLSRLAVYAKALRNETGEDFFALPKLVKMFEYTLAVQTPPYEYFNNRISTPAFGDDLLLGGNEFSLLGLYYDEVARSNEALASQMYQTWVRAGKSLPSNGVETILMESFFTPIGYTPNLTPLQLNSTDKYNWVGLYMFRNYFGTANEAFMSVMANKTAIGHGHYDQGSFTLYAGSTPLVLDSGVESYFNTTKNWYSGSSSHATVQFRNRDNTAYLNTPLVSDNQKFTTNDAIDTVSVRIADPNTNSAGSHTRNIAYVKDGLDAFVIWDQIKGATTGTIWNLPVTSSKLSVITGNKVESTGHYNMDMETNVLQPSNPLITQEWGRTTPLVPAIDGETKLEYIRVTAGANENYLTVLYPKAKGKAGLTTELISSENGVDIYRLLTEDSKWVLLAVNNGDTEANVSVPVQTTLVELRTGNEYAASGDSVSFKVEANGMAVLKEKAADQEQIQEQTQEQEQILEQVPADGWKRIAVRTYDNIGY